MDRSWEIMLHYVQMVIPVITMFYFIWTVTGAQVAQTNCIAQSTVKSM